MSVLCGILVKFLFSLFGTYTSILPIILKNKKIMRVSCRLYRKIKQKSYKSSKIMRSNQGDTESYLLFYLKTYAKKHEMIKLIGGVLS